MRFLKTILNRIRKSKFISVKLILILFLTVITFSHWPPIVLAEVNGKATTEDSSAAVIRKVFDNGLVVLIKPNSANEVVSVHTFIRMGGIYEPKNQRGISKLMQRVLTKGTPTRSAKDIVFETESVGASIEANIVDHGSGNVSLKTTLIGLDTGLKVLLDILEHPVFPAKEVDKEKQMMLQDLATIEDHPVNTAFLNYLALFYGDYPVGVRPEDIAKMVNSLTQEDLLTWYRKIYIPNNMVISIVGKVDPAKIEKIFLDSLGRWPKGKELMAVPTVLPAPQNNVEIKKVKDSQALFMVLGYPAPEITSADLPVMSVINYILGGDMGSRLFIKLRDERGLAYNVSTEYYAALYPSNIFAFIATAPENYKAARDGIIAEFERLTVELVPGGELQDAIQALKGSFLMSHETNSDQGRLLGGFEMMGLGFRHDLLYPEMIEKVTAEDIGRVAKKYFQHYFLSVVSPVEMKE